MSYITFPSRFNRLSAFFAVLVAVMLSAHSSVAASTFNIAGGDSGGLQNALNNSHDGDIIELAAGTFSAPSGAFQIYAVTQEVRSITVRAAAGANVTIDGGNSTDLVRYTDPNCRVRFERITFSHGVSASNAIGGAFTLQGGAGSVKAVFANCVFDSNAANGPTGGGALWIDSASVVYFDSCTWTNNTAQSFGGAASIARNCRVFIRNGRFAGNKSGTAGSSHLPNSDGGALHIADSLVRIDNCAFDTNSTGYTGGALSVIGAWNNSTTTEVTVTNSLFTNNSALQPRTNAFNTPTFAGAIHAEANTTLTVSNSRFIGNSSQQGGAIGLYLSAANFDGCVFKDNQTSGSGADESQGGTIAALSAEPGTNVNHRPVQLTLRNSLFQSTTNAVLARQGGFIFIAGDVGAAYGIFGQQQNGSLESNRSPMTISSCAFVGGSVQNTANVGGDGGAIESIFANATIEDSIFTNCTASNSAGGLMVIDNSVVSVARTTFTHCTAGRGAAVNGFGSTLNMSACNFARNTGSTTDGAGSVLLTGYSLPDSGLPALDMLGSVSNSVFSDNVGKFVIYDSDRGDAPVNRFQYSANQFYPDRSDLFWSDVVGAKNVAGLNALVVPHSDGTTVTKAPQANTALATAPAIGAVLLLPPVVLTQGAPGETTPIPSYLVFATAGGNVSIDGTAQNSDSGVIATTSDTVHTLIVGATTFRTTPPPEAALNISTRLPVGTDQNVLIGGFIITPQGAAPKRVLVRAIGPSLPVSGALQNPVLELHDKSGALVAQNDNWRVSVGGPLITQEQSIDIEATGAAPTNDAESALIVTLNPYPETYTAVVRGANNTTGNALVEIFDLDNAQSSTLANISTRGFVQTVDNVMIGGFIVLGGSGTTKIVVRGLGPSLPVNNPLADPTLELVNSQGTTVETNDDWGSSPHAADLQAASLAPPKPQESAIYRTDLARGAYTAVLRGKNGGTGVGLVEVYVFQ